ncbi:MAG: hypothetical protein CMG57_07075 [Candidatus Marinimicrobia bacterium]|nr:hypothetical protein [Candidatus Neomarinimicrobiota bacterium]
MILNRIELGTPCTVRETGETGSLKKIYFYPTKYEIEFRDGNIKHFSSKDLDFEGIQQPEAILQKPAIPYNGIGEQWTTWSPFSGESIVKHHFSTTKEIIWKMLTSIDMYNVWFHGIQRALPIVDIERYVHRYSFTHFRLEPGAFFKIRPKTIAPYFNCRIMSLEKEKKFGFTFKTTPITSEYIQFTIDETEQGVWVTCRRTSEGLFSLLTQFNWEEKSKILQRLDSITPKIEFLKDEIDDTAESSKSVDANQFGGFASRQDYINYAINMGIEGNMDFVNSIIEKPIRGIAKAGIVKAKRTGEIPPKPDKPKSGDTPTTSSGGLTLLSKDELIAYLVNTGLDGDMDAVNAHDNKIQRGKAKAMIVKIKRGAADRPPMPKIPEDNVGVEDKGETDEQMMERLIAKGLEGDMDEINALENKVLRGKIKAAIIKAKRAAK